MLRGVGMKVFQLKDVQGIRYFPAIVYDQADAAKTNPIIDEEQVHEMMVRDGKLVVVANRFDQDNNEFSPFQGELKQEEILRITQVDYSQDSVNLDMIMSLSEAAEKWGLADGASIRMAIDRGKFKPNEIKRCGHVWIVTYPGMQRVFGAVEDNVNDISLSHIEIVGLFSKVVGTCLATGIRAFFHRKSPEVDFSEIDAAVRLKKLFTEALHCIDRGGRVIIRLYILPDSSIIKSILNTRQEFIQWLERMEYSGSFIDEKLKAYLFSKE
jgi:hypothetical protein